MVQVWGAMAPARLVLFLLLMAMYFQETCAAPWRAPGADDELSAPFPGDPLDPDSVRVPVGQPRGPAGESAEWNPVYEPEGDAGDVTGGSDPGSPLGSGTETPADHMGPEGGKDESKRVEYSQGSSHLLNELLKEMEKAARGTDQQTAQDALQEGSHPTLPVWDRETQTAPTTGMPGMNAGKNTRAAVQEFVQVLFFPVIALLLTVLLSALVMTCTAVSWMWQKYPVCKRAETTPGQAHPDSVRERGQSGGEGRAELGEATKDDVVAQENKNLYSGSSPFPSSFEAEFEYLCSKIRTDPSLWPTCPSSSPMDSVSSPDTRGSWGSP